MLLNGEQTLKKVYSRAATKSIHLLQPEHGFCQQNESKHDQLQDWYPDETMVVAPVCLNRICCSSGCLSIISCSKRWRRWASAFSSFSKTYCQCSFRKYSKEGRLSSSHEEFKISHQIFAMITQNIISCRLNTGVLRTPLKYLRWSVFV